MAGDSGPLELLFKNLRYDGLSPLTEESKLKITDLETIVLSYDLPTPMWDAKHFISSRKALLVKIYTDEQLTGIGEVACFGMPPTVVQTVIEKGLRPYLMGEDPFFVEKLWNKVYQGSAQLGRRGIVIAAMSGIDTALWDIVGKAMNTPLYKVLGAYQDRVCAYASGGFYSSSKDVDQLVEEMASYVQAGFTAAKIKVGGLSIKEDVERVRAVREAIGPEIKLMVDANSNLTPKAAIRLAKAIEEYDISWFEEPVSVDDIRGSAKVAESTSIPVAGYETAFTRYEFRDLILAGAVDIVQPDVTWSGGITECRKIATLASAFSLPCAPHSFSSGIALVASMHFSASLPNGGLLEMDGNRNPLREELLTESIEIDEEGYVLLPQKPGLGVELNEGTVVKYRVNAD